MLQNRAGSSKPAVLNAVVSPPHIACLVTCHKHNSVPYRTLIKLTSITFHISVFRCVTNINDILLDKIKRHLRKYFSTQAITAKHNDLYLAH